MSASQSGFAAAFGETFFPRATASLGLPLSHYVKRVKSSETSMAPPDGAASAQTPSLICVPLAKVLRDLEKGIALVDALERFVSELSERYREPLHADHSQTLFHQAKANSRAVLHELAATMEPPTEEFPDVPKLSNALCAICDFARAVDATNFEASDGVFDVLTEELRVLSQDLRTRAKEYSQDLRKAENALASSERSVRQSAAQLREARRYVGAERSALRDFRARLAREADADADADATTTAAAAAAGAAAAAEGSAKGDQSAASLMSGLRSIARSGSGDRADHGPEQDHELSVRLASCETAEESLRFAARQCATRRQKLVSALSARDAVRQAALEALADLSLLWRRKLGKLLQAFASAGRARVREEERRLALLEAALQPLDAAGDLVAFAARHRSRGSAMEFQARGVALAQLIAQEVEGEAARDRRRQRRLVAQAEEGEALAVLPAVALLVFGAEEAAEMAERGANMAAPAGAGEAEDGAGVGAQRGAAGDDGAAQTGAGGAAARAPALGDAEVAQHPQWRASLSEMLFGENAESVDGKSSASSEALDAESAMLRSPMPPVGGFGEARDELCARLEHGGAIARAGLLNALNRFRPQSAMKSGAEAFDCLAAVLGVLLDCARRERDVKAAKSAMMLAQTFHSDGAEGRRFVKDAVAEHPIWTEERFWEELLGALVREALLPLARVDAQWADKANEEVGRRELVQHVHNAAFGQLASTAHSMLELGHTKEQAAAFVRRHAKAYQLPVEQQESLLDHIMSRGD